MGDLQALGYRVPLNPADGPRSKGFSDQAAVELVVIRLAWYSASPTTWRRPLRWLHAADEPASSVASVRPAVKGDSRRRGDARARADYSATPTVYSLGLPAV